MRPKPIQGIAENTPGKLVVYPHYAQAMVTSVLFGFIGLLTFSVSLFLIFDLIRWHTIRPFSFPHLLIALIMLLTALFAAVAFVCALLRRYDEVTLTSEGVRLFNGRRRLDQFIAWQDIRSIHRTESEYRGQVNHWTIPGFGRSGISLFDVWVDTKAVCARFPESIPIVKR